MKKIIFVFLTLFIFVSTPKALSKFYIGEKVHNMYIESETYNDVPFIIRRDDNRFVYSLKMINKIEEKEYYQEYNYNDKSFNLTDKQLDRINLLGYYGYQYENHTDIKWYAVTQFLIWKTLYSNVYFTDTKDGNKINAYEEEISEIESLVNDYLTVPSFSNKSYEISIGTGFDIYDHNKVIDDYEIKSSNINAYIKDNKLNIESVKEPGDYQITLIRKSPVESGYILYGLENSQSLILPGKVNDIEVNVNIKISSGSITINKIDGENQKREFATLEGAEYGVYDVLNRLISTVKTDENGIAYINNLPLNQFFYIKELIPSKGYKVDSNIYKTIMTTYEKDVFIYSPVDVIKGNLIINKYYDNRLEDGAKFEIYDINNNLIGTYETENGIINIKLEYGQYYIVQVDGIENYNYIDRFNITIEEGKEYIIDLYSEKIEDKNIKVEDKNDIVQDENIKVETEEVIEENNKEEDEYIIVEVPNTKKIDYEMFVSVIFVIIGLILVFKSKKKTTHY